MHLTVQPSNVKYTLILSLKNLGENKNLYGDKRRHKPSKRRKVSSQKYWENHIMMNHILTVCFAPWNNFNSKFLPICPLTFLQKRDIFLITSKTELSNRRKMTRKKMKLQNLVRRKVINVYLHVTQLLSLHTANL